MIDENKKQRGGYRHGAGAKKVLNNPIRITIILEKLQLDWILEQGAASPVIREIIAQAMEDSR